MAALAPALEEASAPAVLQRLDGEIRGVIEEFRGEAESLVSTLGPGGGSGGLLEGMGAEEEEEVGEGGEGGGDVVPEGEAAARLTRECGASVRLRFYLGGRPLCSPSHMYTQTPKSHNTARAHARAADGEARRLARLQAKGEDEGRAVEEYWAERVQSLRWVGLDGGVYDVCV